MTIKYVSGDLLTYPAEAIVNTVNCVGVMGKGIALEFKHKYPENFKHYVAECKAGNVITGQMLVFDLGILSESPRLIINFPTKQHWRNNSTYEYIASGLDDLVQQIKKYNIKSLALPQLGCGNGGLAWDKVRQIIVDKLSLLNTEVYIFAPDPKTNEINNNLIDKHFKDMTLGRAILLLLMYHYQQLRYALTNLEIQKLAYFIKASGEETLANLKFEKNKFGPYSPELKKVVDFFVMNGLVERFRSDESSDSQYKVSEHAYQLASAFLESNHDLQCVDRIKTLISGYETPFGMELLSTVHWVMVNEAAIDLESIKNRIWNWSSQDVEWNIRKKELMSEKYINIAFKSIQQRLNTHF